MFFARVERWWQRHCWQVLAGFRLPLCRPLSLSPFSRRRRYDITNVLEGVGLLEKRSKNTIVWRGSGAAPGGSAARTAAAAVMRARLSELDDEGAALDAAVAALSHELLTLQSDPEHAPYAYVTRTDLRELALAEDATLLAVRCPEGTRLHFAGA